MSLLILVVDDEPDVEVLFRQHFRRDLRAGRFTMEFAQSGPAALQRIHDAVAASILRTGFCKVKSNRDVQDD
jgi:CheY-like chemotaxis protein